ncbi:PaaI family thioesterase [Sphingopyxis sp.]|uniref:PaaI family thioesterase n=1 Tax=Sphingopyxis sp. TaxID=1908224 RepID=UPI003D6D4E0C
MTDTDSHASRLQAQLEDSPFHQLFQMTIASVDTAAQTLALRLDFTSAVERQAGTGQYHGGAIASLIDIAGDYALIAILGHGVPTINFRVDYLRPASGAALVATATVRRAGRTVGVVDIDVEDDAGRLVAIGRGCYGTQAG